VSPGLLDSVSRSDSLRYGRSSVYISRDFALGAAVRAQASFSAGSLSEAAGAMNASNRRAVGCRVPGNIEIHCFPCIRAKVRLR
jgi:hypothetical protein